MAAAGDNDDIIEIVEHLKGLPLQELFDVIANSREKFEYLPIEAKLEVLTDAAHRAHNSGAKKMHAKLGGQIKQARQVANKEINDFKQIIENLKAQAVTNSTFAGGFAAFFSDGYRAATAIGFCAMLSLLVGIVADNNGEARGYLQAVAEDDSSKSLQPKFDPAAGGQKEWPEIKLFLDSIPCKPSL